MTSKTVLVAGGAGYIGTHMVKELLHTGHTAVTVDDLSRGHHELVPGGTFVKGDLGDSALLDRVFGEHSIDAVMHFAAHSLVGESVEQPLDYYRNNIARTVELLDAMRRHNVQHFIFSSSAAVYGEPDQVPISEDHPCRPTNPYGATKLAVERLLGECETAFGLKSVSLRYFNAAGADESATLGERHDPETHLIPLILQVASGKRDSIKIFGTDYRTPDGTCLRDYVHVSDLTRAHLLALQALLAGGGRSVYNLGNSTGHSVRQVIEITREITQHEIPATESARRAGDPAVLIADSSRARTELGWQPRFEDLRSIIETAWAWQCREAS